MATPAEVENVMMEATRSIAHCPGWLVEVLEYLQTASDLIGLTLITFGFIVSAVRWVIIECRLVAKRGDSTRRWNSLRGVRIFLGNYILIGLEFMIVSDIIHSFLKPDMESLYLLGAIVVIRTAISFFLGKELESVKHEAVA